MASTHSPTSWPSAAIELRAPLQPSAATGAAVRVIREAGVPGPGPDQYMAPQLAAAEQALRDGSVLAAVAEALAGASADAAPQDLAEDVVAARASVQVRVVRRTGGVDRQGRGGLHLVLQGHGLRVPPHA